MKFLLAILLFVCRLAAHGQVTLTPTDYPASMLGTDNLKKTVYTSWFPSFPPIAGSAIDMAGVTDSTPVFYAYRVASATHQYADSNEYFFSGLLYKGNVHSNITGAGIFQYGITIQHEKYSLAPLTLGANDSLFIVAQNAIYSSPHISLLLPATFNSFWNSTYSSDVNYELSVVAYGFNHTPGFIRRYTTEYDTVIGWGKLRVNDAWGLPGDYLNVLQLKTTTMTTDSFFLNGAPMSFAMLALLNLTQGKKDTVYEQNFYRPKEVTPLATVTFRDAGHTQPYKATHHTQRLIAVGVADIAGDGVGVYPNPVVGRQFSVPMTEDGNCSYKLIAADGRMMVHGKLTAGGTRAGIELPNGIAAGIYTLQLSSAHSTACYPICIENP